MCLYNNLCLRCHSRSGGTKYTFCSKACARQAAEEGPRLLRVPRDHIKYQEVEARFTQGWDRGPIPSIKKVFLVTWSTPSYRAFDQYRNQIERSGHFARAGQPFANEQKCFRGTQRVCSIGEGVNTTICRSSGCRLCETLRHGFGPWLQEKQMTGVNGRLGTGIYSTPDSSKADKYAINTWNSNVQVQMLCRVVIGQPYITQVKQPGLCAPPAGYASVCAQAGFAFSSDECAVYDEDAIRPQYLVVYEKHDGKLIGW